MDSVWTIRASGFVLLTMAAGACAPEPEPPEEVRAAALSSTVDDACTTAALTATGNANGKTISLLNAGAACTFYGGDSTIPYGGACDGYIMGFTDTSRLPTPGETLRVTASVNAKTLSLMNAADCQALHFTAHAYTLSLGGQWTRYGGRHDYVGSWNGRRCEMTAGPSNGELPPFPRALGNEIRVVASASVGSAQRNVTVGLTLGTCTTTPRGTGALCDADSDCKSAFCAAGSCCGPTEAERMICIRRELLQSL